MDSKNQGKKFFLLHNILKRTLENIMLMKKQSLNADIIYYSVI